jgi:bacterial microcompartment shell protein
MVKSSPVGSIYAGTVHPGKYLVLVSGDTASVELAMATGSEVGAESITGSVFLPDIHPDVTQAIVGRGTGAVLRPEALGIVETSSVSSVIDAADAGVKAADVNVSAVQLADGLGGKGYVLFSGSISEVTASLEAAVSRTEAHNSLLRSDIIAQLHDEMAENLSGDLRFMKRVGGGG